MLGYYSSILYKSFNLPLNEKVRATYRDFLINVDGNIDSNGDLKVNEEDKNGYIEPEELFEEVFNDRGKYQLQIQELYKAGLEDPFEDIPEMRDIVDGILAMYKPQNEIEKALILFRSVIPFSETFRFNGQLYSGLIITENGLRIYYNNDPLNPLRIKYGSLMPKEILSTDLDKRVALCEEYAFLVIMLLRTAGIDAHFFGKYYVFKGSGHAYAVATMGGDKYRLDAAQFKFEGTDSKQCSDRKAIAFHYFNEGTERFKQGHLDEAIRCFDAAIELDPFNGEVLFNTGSIYKTKCEYEKAIECFSKAFQNNPYLMSAWFAKESIQSYLKGITLKSQGRYKEAIRCFDKALEYDPQFVEARQAKEELLKK